MAVHRVDGEHARSCEPADYDRGCAAGVLALHAFNLGLITGKLVLNSAMALGLTLLVQQHPGLAKVFALCSAAYMIWLALRGWNAHLESQQHRRVLSFRDGVLVHPLSPKTWVMVVLAFSEFMPVSPSLPNSIF